jgi:hypothetical protein
MSAGPSINRLDDDGRGETSSTRFSVLARAAVKSTVAISIRSINRPERYARTARFSPLVSAPQCSFCELWPSGERVASFAGLYFSHPLLRALISSRTREALQAVKRRLARQERKLGNPSPDSLRAAQRKGTTATIAASDTFAASVLPIIEGYAAKGLTVRAIAEELNKRGVGTLRGGVWHRSTVVKLRQRAKGQ